MSHIVASIGSFHFPRSRAIEHQWEAGRTTVKMKVRDVIRLLERDGWYVTATRGSHRQFKHKRKPGRVTVAGKPSHDLAAGTLNSILKQAQLKGKI